MRIIYADQLRDWFQNLAYDEWNQGVETTWASAFSVAAEIVDNTPTADAVEIVRCKDCKHLSSDRIAPEWNRICRKYGVGKSDDGFCDEVERKETEDAVD